MKTFFTSALLFVLLLTLACSSGDEMEAQALRSRSADFENNNGRSVDINHATAEELATLPGIGPGLAARIIEHRRSYGKFRKPEHLMMVRGIGDKRFRKLEAMVKAG